MEQILPVGSVVGVQEKKLMLLGAALKELEGALVLSYYAVPYPRGFVTVDSLGFISARAIDTVYARGYEDPVGTRYLEGITELYRELEGKKMQEAEQILAQAGQWFGGETEKLRREKAGEGR